MTATDKTTSSFNLTIGEAQDLMQEMKSAIHTVVNDFAAKTGLFVYLNGGPDANLKRHVIEMGV